MLRKLFPFTAILILAALPASGQSWKADLAWYDPAKTYIKLYFTTNTVAEVDIASLTPHGFPAEGVAEDFIHIYEKGIEIPIEIARKSSGNLQAGDKIRWITRRQAGMEERWAYHLENTTNLSGASRSIYSDTVVYWLTWDSRRGIRFANDTTLGKAPFFTGYRDTVYLEKDSTAYYEGSENFRDLSSYTDNEGYYWREFNLTNAVQLNLSIETQTITNLLWRERDSLLTFQARFQGLSSGGATAAKRANIDVIRDLPDGSGAGYSSIAQTEWNTATTRVISGSISPASLRDTSKLQMRIRVENRSSNRTGVNLVNFDWLKFSYFRGFSYASNLIRFGYKIGYDGIRSVRMAKFLPSDTLRIYIPETGVILRPRVQSSDSTLSYFYSPSVKHPLQHIVVKNRAFSAPIKMQRHTFTTNLVDATNEGEFLIVTRPMFRTEAVRYAAYRAQQSGLTAMVVEMDDIWTLFDHGSQRPIALKRFLHYTMSRWNKPPRFVFIVADASDPVLGEPILSSEVPSFGIPPSDDWFVQNWTSPTDFRTQLSVGRITAKTVTEFRQYQSKVRAYERQIESAAWKKRVVLLSGGNSTIERQSLLNSNRSFARLASRSIIAADTILVAKTSNDPLGVAPRSDLKKILDDGVFMLHFFGHSAPNSWDLLTDDPAQFGNVNRPNIVLSLGCYSGRFTSTEGRIISEQFVFAPNASVAFIGGSGAGQTPALQRYGEYFYGTMFNEEVAFLGDAIRRTKRRHFEANQTAVIDLALLQNSVLLGDPALKIALPDKPEYLFESAPFIIRPEPTNVADSTMKVRVNMLNWGRRPAESVLLRLEQERPDRSKEAYVQSLQPFNLKTFTEFNVKLKPADAGVHTLKAYLDSDGQLDETSKDNNFFQANHQVFSTSADIIYPAHLGIHNSKTPKMIVASPTFTSGVTLQVQLDTLSTFSAPIRSESIRTTDISIVWSPSITLKQLQNYWWRVRMVDASNEPITSWRTASFFVDTLRSGNWWYQNGRNYRENTFSLTLNQTADGKFEFAQVDLPVSTSTSNFDYGRANNATFTASTRVNGVEYGRRVISFHVLALDGGRGRILIDRQYTLHTGQYGSGPINVTTAQNEFIADMATLKPGDYVITRVRHVQQIFPSSGILLDPRILTSFSSIGGFKAGNGVNGTASSQIDGTSGYILFGKKGATSPSETSEYIVRTNMEITRDTVFRFNAPDGDMISQLAGPARMWRELRYTSELENFTSEASIEVYGFRDLNSQPVILLKTDRFKRGNQVVSLAGINAKIYPYVHLKAVIADSTRSTTPQIPSWSIQFDPVPEIALDPFKAVIPRDTLQEGAVFQLAIDAVNLAVTPADTVFADFFDRLDNGAFELVERDTILNMIGNSTRTVNLNLSTRGKVGNHQMLVQLRTTVPDQYAYNNLFSTNFVVVPDREPPKIEVYLDNRFIAPQKVPITDKSDPNLLQSGNAPVIEIRWKDSNELFLIDDPKLLTLIFNGQQVASDDPSLVFTPAENAADNRAKAVFRPTVDATKDSIYTLQVIARDVAENVAEQAEGYVISFRVTNQTAIPSLYPYPNPMSGFTYFTFQLLTPSLDNVEQLRISVFTLNGRPVRVIDVLKNDANLIEGGLKTGWNKVLWNGRDQDGGLLANGVYLYKVDFKAGGETLPVNNSRSIEKLVIIR